jgi:hypothetical protein
MKNHATHRLTISAFALLAGLLSIRPAPVSAQVAAPAPIAIRGKITSVLKGPELIITNPTGDAKLILTDKTVIRGETAIKFSDILPGMYLGTTASKQPDGNFLASEVHVFSEDQRGTGEGHRPLASDPQSGATMTNANVERVEDIAVQDIKGRVLTLKYKGGEVKVLVPPDIPIVRRELADRGALKPGAEISAQAVRGEGGSNTATQITVRAAAR